MVYLSKVFYNFVIILFISGATAELFTLGLVGTALGVGSYFSYCKYFECCNDDYINFNFKGLKSKIDNELFGQPLAKEVIYALRGHLRNSNLTLNKKALTLSFHGYPGNGKNFLTNMIIDSLFKNGRDSNFFKIYMGRHHFPDPKKVAIYRIQIIREIKALLKSCPRSLIVFDEVNDIHEDIIDAIKTMIDFHGIVDGVDYSKATFILISNIGGNEIMERYLELNKPRNDIKLADFENVIRTAAYAKGGLKGSGILSSNLIDHYIPFLPLEETHVKMCLQQEFKEQGMFIPSQAMIDTAMSVVTYGPTKNPIFANAGCKRIRNIVSYVIAKSP